MIARSPDSLEQRSKWIDINGSEAVLSNALYVSGEAE